MNCLVPPPSLLLLFIIPDRPLWKPSRALVTTVATTAFMPAVKPTAGFRCRAVAQLGNSANLGISVGGNIGKGCGDDESHTRRHIHIGDKGSQTVIRSGDTSLGGAQVIGKGIRADSRNLNIESVQDTAAYHGKQQNGSLQITAGYGASINGNYSQSNIRAEHEAVTEQSGIYAGAHTDLKSGLITSTPSVEDNCKNRFSTDMLTFRDLHNHSAYQGEILGVDTEIAVSGRTLGQESLNARAAETQAKAYTETATDTAAYSGSQYRNQSTSGRFKKTTGKR